MISANLAYYGAGMLQSITLAFVNFKFLGFVTQLVNRVREAPHVRVLFRAEIYVLHLYLVRGSFMWRV